MPISNIAAPYGQHISGNTKLLIPVLDKQGQLQPVVDGAVWVSYPFDVVDQPMTLVASNFSDAAEDILQVQVSPEGVTWQDLWIHGTAIQLTPHNSLIHISVPGTYRLVRPGWHILPPDIPPPSNILLKSTASGWYGTLTHEPAVGMIPDVGSVGPQGPIGAQGLPGAVSPPSTGLFIISPTAPDLYQYVAGSAWWDSDNGRAYILYDDGTSRQWVEFIGAPSIANFIISPTAPPVNNYMPGSAWWDSDNGRVFILFDDGSSKQWVEFIGAPATGGGGGSGAQGPQGDVGPQGPPGASGSGAWNLQILDMYVGNEIVTFEAQAIGQFGNFTVRNDNVSGGEVRINNLVVGAMVFLSIEGSIESTVSSYSFTIDFGSTTPMVTWPGGSAPSIVNGLIILCVTGPDTIRAMVADYS